MTVASEVNKSGPYIGNGVTTVFDYDFRIIDETHIRVVRTQAGVETVLALGADYTVAGVGDAPGGSITMTVAPTAAQTITNMRGVPFTQEMDLENQGPYFAETVESAFDLSVMRDQQLSGRIDLTEDLLGEIPEMAAEVAANTAIVVASTALAEGYMNSASASAIAAVTAMDTVLAGIEPYFPEVIAWKQGVPGNGTDQTAALQALVNAMPSTGGIIYLKGSILVSFLNLTSARYVRFVGQGRQKTILYCTGGAIGAGTPVIDCHGASFCRFEHMNFYASDPAFNGTMIEIGNAPPGAVDSPHMSFFHCDFGCLGANATAKILWLYGATLAKFDECRFSAPSIVAPGSAIQFQNASGVVFSNGITFNNCYFFCIAGTYMVQGSGEAISFNHCNIQNSNDGQGRWLQTDVLVGFRAVTVNDCSFYADYPASGASSWIKAHQGSGLNVTGNMFSGGALQFALEIGGGTFTGDPGTSGVQGFVFAGNACTSGNGIKFTGNTSPSVLTCARAGEVLGNYLHYQMEVFTDLVNCLSVRWGFNSSYAIGATSGVGFTPGNKGGPVAVLAIKKQVIAASGTYTPSAGMLYCIVRAVGGGGGGGGVTSSSTAQVLMGGGGGAGGYSESTLTAAQIGASQVATIGAAGSGGAAGSNNGGAGTATSLGALVVANGGAGGTFALTAVNRGVGGAGGAAGTGDIANGGSPGFSGAYATGAFYFGSPNGGSSFFGGAGSNFITAAGGAAHGTAATGYGSGGGGGATGQVVNNASGGGGKAGVIYIIEFCSQV